MIWEDLALAFLNAIGNNHFFNMMQNVKENPAFPALCEGLLEDMNKHTKFVETPTDSQESQEQEACCHKAMAEAFTECRKCLKAVVALMVPMPGHLGSSVQDVLDTTSYEGGVLFVRNVSMTLQNNPSWQALLDETLKTGSQTLKMAPQLKLLEENLRKTVNSQEVDDAYSEAVEAFQSLQTSLRKGATSTLSELLVKKTKMLVRHLVEKAADDVKAEEVDTISSALKMFLQSDGMLELQRKFEEFKGSIAQKLSVSRLREFVGQNVEMQQFDRHSQLSVLLHETEAQTYDPKLLENLQQQCCIAFQVLDAQVGLSFSVDIIDLSHYHYQISTQVLVTHGSTTMY